MEEVRKKGRKGRKDGHQAVGRKESFRKQRKRRGRNQRTHLSGPRAAIPYLARRIIFPYVKFT